VPSIAAAARHSPGRPETRDWRASTAPASHRRPGLGWPLLRPPTPWRRVPKAIGTISARQHSPSELGRLDLRGQDPKPGVQDVAGPEDRVAVGRDRGGASCLPGPPHVAARCSIEEGDHLMKYFVHSTFSRLGAIEYGGRWSLHKATHVPNRRGGFSLTGPDRRTIGPDRRTISKPLPGRGFVLRKGPRGARTQDGEVSPNRTGRPDGHRCGS
jgi:hypothetical protein